MAKVKSIIKWYEYIWLVPLCGIAMLVPTRLWVWHANRKCKP